MLMKNKKIRNTSICLDGGTFEDCEFYNCELTYCGYLPVNMSNCKFRNIQWSFTGPANNTIQFLKAMYPADTNLIENTFELIRGNPPKSGPVLH